MSGAKIMMPQYALQRARMVPKRVLLIGAGALLGIVALAIWAGLALLGAAWSQVPQLTAMGKRSLENATVMADQALPELVQRAQTFLAGIEEPADQLLPAADVSGNDIGPVERFPGLVREHFAQEPGRASVRYVGDAALRAVLTHYSDGFAGAGFTQNVLSAAPGRELHRFVAVDKPAAYELSIEAVSGGLLAVTISEITS